MIPIPNNLNEIEDITEISKILEKLCKLIKFTQIKAKRSDLFCNIDKN